MRSALATEPAAYEAGYDLDHDEVYVGYDAAAGDARTVARALVTAVDRAGFDAWLKGPGWPEGAPNVTVLPE